MVPPKYTFSYEKKGCPLATTRYFCKFRPKRVWNYAYLACKIISLGKGAPPLATTYVYILTEKGLNLCIYGSSKYTFFYEKKAGCSLQPPENLDHKGPEIMR